MRWFFRIFIVLPIALAIVTFAVANRHYVKLSLDPLPLNDIEGPYLDAPLFALLFATGVLGVLAGGVAVWWRQRKYRREARVFRDEASEARAQAIELRDRLAALDPTTPALPSPRRDAA